MRSRTIVKLLAALLLGGGAAFYVLTIPYGIAEQDLPPRAADAANGEAMFNIGGCASCHATPEQDDRTQLGGGLALSTSFGTFKVPNISADRRNGIGAWSEAAFVNAMLRGVGRNGEHLYPMFPYMSYQRMTLGDVRDLFAYLKTLPAVDAPSAPHELSFPFSVRRGLGLWKLLYLDGKPFAPGPGRDVTLDRGAYLVEGPGHCAECHSRRDALGGIITDGRFAGGLDAAGKSWVPNVTPHEDGIGKWSQQDIAYLLESGFTPNLDSVGSTMADVVLNTGKLSADDRLAMAAYLKSLPPRPGKRPVRKDQ